MSKRARPSGKRRPAFPRLAAMAALLTTLSACTLQPASNHGKQIQSLYYITFAFAAVIFVVVGGLIVVAPIRFRRKHGDQELPKQVHGNTKLEVVWVTVPTLIVAVLFVLSAMTLGKVDSAEANSMTINVTGFQWQWRFTYPGFKTSDGTPLSIVGETGQTARLPVLGLELDQPTHFHLESVNDVIHSFFIPNFLFKRDVVPGHPNDFTLTPSPAGTFPGECAELCGLYHSRMLFSVQIMPKAQFDQWIQEQIKIQESHHAACTQASGGKLSIDAVITTKFNTACLQAQAGQAFQLVFDNKDTGIPHNVEIYSDSSATKRLGGATGPSDFITGPATTTYSVSALPAGTYYFRCDIHPGQMNGQFIVK